MRISLLLLALAACDDVIFRVEEGGLPTGEGGEGWCGVRATFAAQCVQCHAEGGSIGGLDLVTDPHAAVVDVESSEFPDKTLIVPGDPEGSLLFRKITGTQGSDEGTSMPPGQTVDEAVAQVFRDWIAAGADDVCDGGVPTGTGGGQGVHPEGWALPDAHGLATKLQTDIDCRTCHGDQLQGDALGAGIACDDCHQDDWETTCTFCHGGVENETGAPPEDIDDGVTALSFPAHTVHVEPTIHAAWDCAICHNKPLDALTPGHLFDDSTSGVAEVVFGGDPLAPTGSYDGNGGCSNLYCHGTGLVNGDVGPTETRTCHMCHPDATSPEGLVDDMSGKHDEHVGEVPCGECHGEVVEGASTIVAPALHVDGSVSTSFPQPQMQVVDDGAGVRTCTGTCHEEEHPDPDEDPDDYRW